MKRIYIDNGNIIEMGTGEIMSIDILRRIDNKKCVKNSAVLTAEHRIVLNAAIKNTTEELKNKIILLFSKKIFE